MKKILISLPIALCYSIAIASPMGVNTHPKSFCELAGDLGYSSRGYKTNNAGCSSEMVDVTPTPGKNGLRNNLAYYVMGDISNPNKLDYVSMILNVNNIKQKNQANSELSNVASSVLKKITGELPSDFSEIVSKGRSKSWTLGSWDITVKTTTWPTGQGQDTRVQIKPKN